jgi:hypothetical protein
MQLNELSLQSQSFFSSAFDLYKNIETAICRDAHLSGTYPLHYAVMRGNIPVINELIDNGVDQNQLDYSYENRKIFGSLTPLMRACEGIDFEKTKNIIEALLLKNADIHFKNEKNETVLSYSIFIENVNLFEFFLKKGGNPFHDMEVANKLKYRLGNLMNNKPYQFIRTLKLLANSQEEGLIYLNFEKDFLKMLKKHRHYVLKHHQMISDPLLNTIPRENIPDVTGDGIVPRAPRLYRGTQKILMDIKNGEDMVNAFRIELEKQSFRVYLEMTSKLFLKKQKFENDEEPKEEVKRLPVDLEKKLAVEHFGFTYPEIREQSSLPIPDTKENMKQDENFYSLKKSFTN